MTDVHVGRTGVLACRSHSIGGMAASAIAWPSVGDWAAAAMLVGS